MTTFRGMYGGKACTLTATPLSPRGAWYMCFDRDPGFGPMAFPVGAGVTLTGVAHRCPDCGVHQHVSAWPCPAPHGELAPVASEATAALEAAGRAAPCARSAKFYADALGLVAAPVA